MMPVLEQKSSALSLSEISSATDQIIAEVGDSPECLVPLLQAVQGRFGYLPEEALRRIHETTPITPAAIAGVSTFYSKFRHHPVGRHIISVCHGTACHVQGAPQVEDAVRRHLHLESDQDTDVERTFTVEKVACMGCCNLAPVIRVDELTYGHLTSRGVDKALKDFLELERRGAVVPEPSKNGHKPVTGLTEIRISEDSCCAVTGTVKVREALEVAIREAHAPAAIKIVGCNGLCHRGPTVEVAPPGKEPTLYLKVTPAEAESIIQRHFKPSGPVEWAKAAWRNSLDRLLTDESWEPVTRYAASSRDPVLCSFIGPQVRIATEHSGLINPLDLDEYMAHDGFEALRTVLTEMEPDQIIDTITKSGLRGRGGAGFPTGIKWSRVRSASGDTKYVICNGDEGDPGAYMDRMLLESFPYRVLEGMAIGAYAVGAREGILYIRAEYPKAVERIREALRLCEQRGLFDGDFFGNEFNLSLRVVQGGGAFVCGEETALIASIEGKRGEPRLRPPYPAESGLWGRPTCINNVETYALVPWIIRHGAEAFAAIGTEKSTGTKVFSLAGTVQRGGLIEVPIGATIREIVEEIGGGITDGGRFKAVQIGGPSGGCVPAELADTPLDYESLVSAGAIMGSGGMVVLDDRTCMVDLARFFLQFTQYESCGKCTMCRIGTRRLLDILERLCRGEGRAADLEKLDELAEAVCKGSLCGLGQTAPNPILSTLRHFREEYVAHLEGRCPAGKCKTLIHYRVTDTCNGCTLCAQECPVNAIPMRSLEQHEIDDVLCTRCDACRRVCPENSIVIE